MILLLILCYLCIICMYRALEVWGTMEKLVEKQQRKRLLDDEEKRRRKGHYSYYCYIEYFIVWFILNYVQATICKSVKISVHIMEDIRKILCIAIFVLL